MYPKALDRIPSLVFNRGMTVKQKQTTIVSSIIGFWLILLFFFIDTRSKAAAFILPIFTVIALLYFAYLTFWGIDQAKRLGDTPKDKPSDNKEVK
jgi:predicted RND superfamily exporter protein